MNVIVPCLVSGSKASQLLGLPSRLLQWPAVLVCWTAWTCLSGVGGF